MFHHQKNPIRRLHVAAQTKNNELLYWTKSRYEIMVVHLCSFRILWHLYFKNSDIQGLVSGHLVITNITRNTVASSRR